MTGCHVNDPRLVAGELWGGPLDGEWIEALPDCPVTCYRRADSTRHEWYPYAPTQGTTDDWRILGFYEWSGDRRLTWAPAA